jgi:hypothetical protein
MKIVLVADKNFIKIKTLQSLIPKQNANKIKMVATKERILLTDITDYLHIYTLDMEFKDSLNLNNAPYPIKLGAMFNDEKNDQLLVYEVNRGVRVIETQRFRMVDFLRLKINENIFFQ